MLRLSTALLIATASALTLGTGNQLSTQSTFSWFPSKEDERLRNVCEDYCLRKFGHDNDPYWDCSA